MEFDNWPIISKIKAAASETGFSAGIEMRHANGYSLPHLIYRDSDGAEIPELYESLSQFEKWLPMLKLIERHANELSKLKDSAKVRGTRPTPRLPKLPGLRTNRPDEAYFVGASGFFFSLRAIGNMIENGTYREARGLPLRRQLAIVGLIDEFDGGTTPQQLPVSLGGCSS